MWFPVRTLNKIFKKNLFEILLTHWYVELDKCATNDCFALKKKGFVAEYGISKIINGISQ